MSETEHEIGRFLEELQRTNVSPHTTRAYESDLRQFLEYFSPPGGEPPAPSAFDVSKIREWFTALHDRKLTAVSRRRKLAALRTFFAFLVREGLVPMNVPRLISTPRIPKKLPRVMAPEEVAELLEGVAPGKVEQPHPARDRAMPRAAVRSGVAC